MFGEWNKGAGNSILDIISLLGSGAGLASSSLTLQNQCDDPLAGKTAEDRNKALETVEKRKQWADISEAGGGLAETAGGLGETIEGYRGGNNLAGTSGLFGMLGGLFGMGAGLSGIFGESPAEKKYNENATFQEYEKEHGESIDKSIRDLRKTIEEKKKNNQPTKNEEDQLSVLINKKKDAYEESDLQTAHRWTGGLRASSGLLGGIGSTLGLINTVKEGNKGNMSKEEAATTGIKQTGGIISGAGSIISGLATVFGGVENEAAEKAKMAGSIISIVGTGIGALSGLAGTVGRLFGKKKQAAGNGNVNQRIDNPLDSQVDISQPQDSQVDIPQPPVKKETSAPPVVKGVDPSAGDDDLLPLDKNAKDPEPDPVAKAFMKAKKD